MIVFCDMTEVVVIITIDIKVYVWYLIEGVHKYFKNLETSFLITIFTNLKIHLNFD